VALRCSARLGGRDDVPEGPAHRNATEGVPYKAPMPSFLQYHNAARLGWVPLDRRPFLDTRLGIVTRRPAVRSAVGATVYLIVGLGRPKRYFLWERFTVESVRLEEGLYCAEGEGWQLAPPQPLAGPGFEAFKAACGYFIGFQNIDRLPYLPTLQQLADRHRREEVDEATEVFATALIEALPDSADGWFARGFVRLRLGRREAAVSDLREAQRRGPGHEGALREYLALAGGAPDH